MFKIGDYAYDKTTNSVVIVEYIADDFQQKRYLVRNDTVGGFRFEDQLMHATQDLNGNPLPTTNEA